MPCFTPIESTVRFLAALLLISCAGCTPNVETQGERLRGGGGYTPIDPLPVKVQLTGEDEKARKADLLNRLPDSTMRLAIRQVDVNGDFTYGPAKFGTKNNAYQVVLDYIQYTTKPLRFKKNGVDPTTKKMTYQLVKTEQETDIIIPVYIGFGVRLTANVFVNDGTIDLSNLFAIGAAAEAKQVTGTLVIQSLGLFGEGVASAIPIPSEINATTIQSALMAVGTMKAKIYDPSISCTARAVAIYNPLEAKPETVDGIISNILSQKITLDEDDE
jgi:hypothetical protein